MRIVPHIRWSAFHGASLALALLLAPPWRSIDAQETGKALPFLPFDSLTVPISPSLKDSLIRFPHQFIAAGSDTFRVRSRALTRGEDYVLNYREGVLSLTYSFLARELADSTARNDTLRGAYAYFPFHFQESYYHRKLVYLKDSTGADSLRIARPRSSFEVGDIFGPNIQKSGSIVRGFTVGSNRDLTLNSGLRLQLSGKIASDIEVAASLTDENTPIQPEGTTQTLQEFDKVFVEIKSTHMGATLGDFNLSLDGSEFARMNRKLQGAEGNVDYLLGSTTGSFLIAGAITRGKFNTTEMLGQEGVQGPYRLSGRNGERTIIVIAGTEHVFVDGERQTRGETNDYTIDYSTGEITFMPRRLITSASRIVVDFEYTDRQYSRSLLAGQSVSGIFDNKAQIAVTYMREADNPDAPIDLTLNDSVKAVLRNAGADRSKAVLNGVTQVDSNGFYVRVDTTLSGGASATFYRYAPGDPNAKYNVTFSSVGFGKGDYIRQQLGVFVYEGPGGGDYLPVIILPFPELHQLVDVAVKASPSQALSVGGEYAASQYNANRFSTLPGVQDNGYAMKFDAAFSPKDVKIGDSRIGSFDFKVNERYTKSAFVPADRANDIEFNRKWGIDTVASSDEEIREASLSYLPINSISVGGGYGHIDRPGVMNSTRFNGALMVKEPGLPRTDYSIEHVQSNEAVADNRSSWLRQRGTIEHTFLQLTPFARYEGEHREMTSLSTDTLKAGSLRFDDVGGGLRFISGSNLSLSAEYGWRVDDVFNNSAIARQSDAFTQMYAGKLQAWGNFSTSLDVTLRKKTFTEPFKLLGNTDIRTVIVRSQSRYSPFNRGLETDVYYEVSTERSSKLQRVFVRVTQGTGNYKYLGDLNGNGIADESEFILARFDGDYVAVTIPTDALYPIIDLKSSVRLRLTPARFFPQQETALQKALSILTAETYARVDEKSTEPDLKQIYLLHFSHFRRDSTTIAGSNIFTQDLLFWDGQPEFSSRLRFSERKGLSNYANGIERSFGQERSIRIRWQLVQEITNQIDVANKIDRLNSQVSSSRVRDILSNDLTFDLSYRPQQNVEFGFKWEVARSTDRYEEPALQADLNTQSLRLVYAFQGAGQARGEFSREEILLGRTAAIFPYELTGGRVPGKTWIWRFALDYRITDFLQATVDYDGRSEGGSTPIHTARAEVRAFF